MRYFAVVIVTLLLKFSCATVTNFFGSDRGASDANSIQNSLEARDNFLSALQGCWNVRTYDYEDEDIGRRRFSLDSGRTRFSISGGTSDSGVQSAETTNVNALVGFAVSGEQFIRVVPQNRRGSQVQVIWDFTENNVKAFGSFFTGVGTQPGSFSIRFRGGRTQRFPIHVSGGGAFFFGVISDTPFDQVIATSRNAEFVGDVFSVDLSYSAISSSVTTRRVGRFVYVSNSQGCPRVATIEDARSFCACLGTSLADITSSDMSNSEFFQGITGSGTCGQRTFWVNSWNGDNYQGAPLVLNAPSITVAASGSNGVLCNAP